MSNYLEIDSKILEKNLLLKNDSSEADNLENFFRSPENYMKENPSWILATPTAGFCVKTTDSRSNKVFINVCKLDDIPEPKDVTEAELLELWQSDDIPDFRIPLSIQEPHDEFDKSGKPTVAYDVAVNTKFFQKIESSAIFRSFVMQVIMEGLENKYDIEIKKEGYVILQNKKKLGELKPHRIRKSKLPNAGSRPFIEELHSTNTPSSSVDKKAHRKAPDYRLFRNTSSNFLIGEFHLPHVDNSENIFLQPLIQIDSQWEQQYDHPWFPKIFKQVTQDELALYVNENRIVLDHKSGSYFADFFIPVKVNESEAEASFNVTKNMLTVKMPIVSTSV